MSIEQQTPADRLESFISKGLPSCKVCYSLSPDERPDEAEFWPNQPVHYIKHDEEKAFEWFCQTVCEFHDTAEHIPADATHRLIDDPEYIGDEPDRGNSDYRHKVISKEDL